MSGQVGAGVNCGAIVQQITRALMGEVPPHDAEREPDEHATQGTNPVVGVKTRDRVVRKKAPLILTPTLCMWPATLPHGRV